MLFRGTSVRFEAQSHVPRLLSRACPGGGRTPAARGIPARHACASPVHNGTPACPRSFSTRFRTRFLTCNLCFPFNIITLNSTCIDT